MLESSFDASEDEMVDKLERLGEVCKNLELLENNDFLEESKVDEDNKEKNQGPKLIIFNEEKDILSKYSIFILINLLIHLF